MQIIFQTEGNVCRVRRGFPKAQRLQTHFTTGRKPNREETETETRNQGKMTQLNESILKIPEPRISPIAKNLLF
jgi:hypothetical protein